MKASAQLSNLRRNLVIDYRIKEEYVLEFVELYDKLTELESKILNERIFSSDDGDFCPSCKSPKILEDNEYYYCPNKNCGVIWAKSQERSV